MADPYAPTVTSGGHLQLIHPHGAIAELHVRYKVGFAIVKVRLRTWPRLTLPSG